MGGYAFKLATFLTTIYLLFTLSLCAQESYRFSHKIDLPNDGNSDFSAIDSLNRRLYVTHTDNVHVIDLKSQELIHTISGLKGTRGIAIVNSVNKGFITDGKDNTVLVVDLVSFEILERIPLQGKKPSTIIFDSYANQVLAFCTDSHSISVIDIYSLKETGTIHLPGEPEYVVADGKGLVYINLEDKNSIAVFNSKTLQLKGTYQIPPCKGPFALAMDVANNRLFSGCRENKGVSVINTENQQVITTLPIGEGVGTVSYDLSEKILIAANADGTAQIFQQYEADNYRLIQTLQTFQKAKTFAVDPTNKDLYFSASQYRNKTLVPNSFALYVYKKIIQ